jgi:hypothetical protein
MLSRENRDYVLQETAAIHAQLSIVRDILENAGIRLESIEDWAFEAEQKKADWHYDTLCKCERCSAMRNMWSGRFDDADDYRMD